jgi:tetratricopeptide (TPR) repeat protein
MMGDYQACRALGQTLLAIDPMQPWGYLLLGTWAVLGDSSAESGDVAGHYIASARELAAQSPYALIRLGGLELARQNLDAAMADFAAALALEPHSGEAAYGLGLTLYHRGQQTAAEHALRLAIRLEHHQPLAHLQLGLLLCDLRRWPEAIPTLETALAQGSEAMITIQALDRARSVLGQLLSSSALAERA